ncbi:hypothetical protein [Geodermatophilus marinus]|uniref:hypothetical protein n=1 Tax=Geodermatophilus sp. LHW52908 TaxID=2303986 RepID=UPI0011C110DD|nr:hypothetical protein [Geodermatophilus sp. LHW52908]
MKTAVPRLAPGYVPRPRLLGALAAATAGQVVVVSAPAGYGKTLLLADWVGRGPGATAWVSLDEDDDDDQRLWSTVLTALTGCAAVPAGSSLARLAVPAHPGRDSRFLAAAVNAVDLLAVPLRLVLDDVHVLTAAGPRHGLAALVRDPRPRHLRQARREHPARRGAPGPPAGHPRRRPAGRRRRLNPAVRGRGAGRPWPPARGRPPPTARPRPGRSR